MARPDPDDDDATDPTVARDKGKARVPSSGPERNSTLPPDVNPAAGALESSVERYVERQQLGLGSMGEVFLCKDTRIGRDVAKKVLLPNHRHDATLRARFLRETRIQGQLEHPSIVPVYDLGLDDDGSTYFTMKCLRGMTLKQVLRGLRDEDAEIVRKYNRRRLLTAFSSVCLTIDFAHSRGVLHRDLKPSNVMLGNYGEVYVLDWGIAKLKEEVAAAAAARHKGAGQHPRSGRHRGAPPPGRGLRRHPHRRRQDPGHLRLHGPRAGARRHRRSRRPQRRVLAGLDAVRDPHPGAAPPQDLVEGDALLHPQGRLRPPVEAHPPPRRAARARGDLASRPPAPIPRTATSPPASCTRRWSATSTATATWRPAARWPGRTRTRPRPAPPRRSAATRTPRRRGAWPCTRWAAPWPWSRATPQRWRC